MSPHDLARTIGEYAHEHGASDTLAVIENIAAALHKHHVQESMHTMRAVISAEAAALGISFERFTQPERKHTYAEARRRIYFLLMQKGFSSAQISKLFNRESSTIRDRAASYARENGFAVLEPRSKGLNKAGGSYRLFDRYRHDLEVAQSKGNRMKAVSRNSDGTFKEAPPWAL